jgi:nucleoside-diphosphate-sugar epimerase
MNVLVVGGAGSVGTAVLPHLARQHNVRVFDLAQPLDIDNVEWVPGDLFDAPAVEAAAEGMDALIYMAMGPRGPWGEITMAQAHLQVATAGLYTSLRAVAASGVRRAIYTSSMSVYRSVAAPDAPVGPLPREESPPDAVDFYGLAKQFGEQVGRAAVVEYGLDVVALRLCFPIRDEDWPPQDPKTATIATSGRDVAGALEAALAYQHRGFDVFAISGDAAGRIVSIDKARRLLGWQPQDPTTGEGVP